MSNFPNEKKKRLLTAAKKVHEHKIEKIFGFKILMDLVEDELIKKLLKQVKSEEEALADLWVKRIKELGGYPNKRLFEKHKLKILFNVLGTKSFFQWVLEEEEEGIKEVAWQAEIIQDSDLSETWSRYASDEIRHLQRTKTQIFDMDSWDFVGTSGARSVSTIYSGLYGGLLSTLSFLTGVFGAQSERQFFLLSGLATLFAGTISSAGGGYQSLKSEMEVLVRERDRNIENNYMMKDRNQLLEFYYSEGYSKEEAHLLLDSLNTRPITLKDEIEKIGLSTKEFGNPINNAIYSGTSFAIGSLIPIIPFTIQYLKLDQILHISIIMTMFSLFLIGAAKSIFSRKRWIRSGVEVMIFGAIASTITYLIGVIVSRII